MAKKKPKNCKLIRTQYNTNIIFVYGTRKQLFCAIDYYIGKNAVKAHKKGLKNLGKEIGGYYEEFESVLWINISAQTFQQYLAGLTHELIHAMLDIYNLTGVRFNHENQEPHAYFMGDLTRQAHELMFKVNKKSKK